MGDRRPEGLVTAQEIGLIVVEVVLSCMYWCEYGDSASLKDPNGISPLLFNTHVQTTVKKHVLRFLNELAVRKSYARSKDEWMSTSFAVAVEYAYSCALIRDHGLRRMIISPISRPGAELCKDSKGGQLRETVGTAPAFVIDLVDDLAKINRGSEATDFEHNARYACSSRTGVFAVASNYR